MRTLDSVGIAAVGALALASGAASVSLAQGTMTFSWTIGDTGNNDSVLQPGETAILTLWASMDPAPAVGYAGSIFDITGNGDWQTGEISNRQNLVDSLATGPGDLNADNSITGIESFQLPPFFNPGFDASNPIAIYSMEWTPYDYTVRFVEVTSANHQNASVYTDNFGSSVEYGLEISGARFYMIPAPGGAAVAGLGLLALGRRRR